MREAHLAHLAHFAVNKRSQVLVVVHSSLISLI